MACLRLHRTQMQAYFSRNPCVSIFRVWLLLIHLENCVSLLGALENDTKWTHFLAFPMEGSEWILQVCCGYLRLSRWFDVCLFPTSFTKQVQNTCTVRCVVRGNVSLMSDVCWYYISNSSTFLQSLKMPWFPTLTCHRLQMTPSFECLLPFFKTSSRCHVYS